MLTLNLTGETIDELRAQAILALDIRTLSHEQAAAKVTELQAETDSEPLSKETTEAEVSYEGTPGPEKDAAVPLTEPKPKKARAKKLAEKPVSATISDFAQEIEAKADAEAIEVEQPAKPDKLTNESIKLAFNEYIKRFGLDATLTDGPIIISRIFPGISKVRDVPEDDQDKLARTIAAVEAAILTNEFKRPAVQ